MSQPPQWAEVALSVYELHGTSGLNYLTSSAGLGGAYHVAVEVYGLEWSFGFADVGTGVYMVHIGESTLGTFLQRVPLGRTKKTPEQVFAILDKFRRTWRGDHYNLLTRNCANFSVDFSKRLGFPNPPEWINKLATVGADWTGAQALGADTDKDEEDLDAFDDDELEDFAEDGDMIAMLELVWRRSKEYTLEWVEKHKSDARYEEMLVEFRWAVPRDDAYGRNIVLGIMRHARLKQVVAESISMALGLRWKSTFGEEDCPVSISSFRTPSGLRVAVTCRVTGVEHIRKIRAKPRPEDFAKGFKSVMKSAAGWTTEQKAVMDTLMLDTAPGQLAVSSRVLTSSKKEVGAGAILFPRRDFKTPDSVQHTLTKLQSLQLAVSEQSAMNHTLKGMSGPEDVSPWWGKPEVRLEDLQYRGGYGRP